MSLIQIPSIHHAVSKGAGIDLGTDYRTSRTARAWLSSSSSCAFAMSTAAYKQHVQQGAVGEQESRMEAVCAFLSKTVGLGEKPAQSAFKPPPRKNDGKAEDVRLKVEWDASSKYWVILLPDEHFESVATSR